MGLPDILQNMLTVVSGSNSVKNWSIYPEKDGSTTFKIRFCATEESVNHDENIHYRRKSSNQVKRDSQRSSEWQATCNRKQQSVSTQHSGEPCRKKSCVDQPGVVTRSRSLLNDDVETLRSDMANSSHNSAHDDQTVFNISASPFTPRELLAISDDNTSHISPCIITNEHPDDNTSSPSDHEFDVVAPVTTPQQPPPNTNHVPRCSHCGITRHLMICTRCDNNKPVCAKSDCRYAEGHSRHPFGLKTM